MASITKEMGQLPIESVSLNQVYCLFLGKLFQGSCYITSSSFIAQSTKDVSSTHPAVAHKIVLNFCCGFLTFSMTLLGPLSLDPLLVSFPDFLFKLCIWCFIAT